MWSAVFGGGAHVPSKGQANSKALSVEGEKQNRHISPSKVSARESPVSSSSGNQEPPAVKEKFVPPELSIWDYFIAKPFLPPSQSRAEYDSEESLESDDEEEEDDDDALPSGLQLHEHSNSNSFRTTS